MWNCALGAMCLLAVTTAGAQVARSTPPRLQSGAPPQMPVLAVGGGQVFVEVSISPTGEVTGLTPLRTTPPFTEFLSKAVRGWRFSPAMVAVLRDDGLPGTPKGAASKALVAAHFRAPTLLTPTLGEPSTPASSPSAEVAFPLTTVEPPYPPQAQSSGVVLVEALVGVSGQVTEATVIRSAPPFDAAALAAARQWRFRPSSAAGRAAATYAYLIFGFPQPVIGGHRH